jgi:DNA (cytosine-5)-methyltransferase 1
MTAVTNSRLGSAFTFTDQFCGAGGSSLGATEAGGEVRLAMNHWALAISTHNRNFPNADHDCVDISVVSPARYQRTNALITSPECTNHSLAKGVKRQSAQIGLFENQKLDPAAVRSRATMFDVVEFTEHHRYDLIVVENVVDIRKWVLWDAWWQAMTLLGYRGQAVYFNSMFAHLDPWNVQSIHDFVPQSRDRIYVVWTKKNNPIPDLDFRPLAHCEHCDKKVNGVQSWRKPQFPWGRYGIQYDYRCPLCAKVVQPYRFGAINVMDFTKPIQRIGDRKQPLKDKTMARIKVGLDKFFSVYAVDTAYGESDRVTNVSEPLTTQTTRQTKGLVINPFLIYADHGGDTHPPRQLDHTLGTLTGRPHQALVIPAVVTMRGYDTKGYSDPYYRVASVTEPLSTQVATATQEWMLGVQIQLRNHADSKPLETPLATLTAGGNHTGFLMSYYGTGGESPLHKPMPTVTSHDRHALVEAAKNVKLNDCYFRMIQPDEVGKGMAFPVTYKVNGNKREQIRQYGNAVTPPAMSMLLKRCMDTFQ